MKQRSKRLIIALLIAALLCAVLPMFAFANDDDDDPTPEPQHTLVDNKNYIIEPKDSKATVPNAPGATQPVLDTSSDQYIPDSYIMTVYTGSQPGDCVDSIVIHYKTASGALTTQVLHPSESAVGSGLDFGYGTLGVYANGARNENYESFWDGEHKRDAFVDSRRIGGRGSRASTYGPLMSSYPADYETRYYHYTETGSDGTSTPHTAFKYYEGYYSWAQTMLPEPTGIVMTDSPDIFRSYSTEYIHFTTLYPIDTIVSVEFFLVDPEKNVNDWSLLSWRLYKTRIFEPITVNEGYWDWRNAVSAGNRPEFNLYEYKGPNTDFLKDSFPKYTGYSFQSDRQGLIFDGTLIAESNDAELAQKTVGYDHQSGAARFVNDIFEDGSTIEYKYPGFSASSYSPVHKNGMASTDYTFHEIRNGGSSVNGAAITVESEPTTLNFSINISDIYGAGIDSFNRIQKSENTYDASLMDLNEMLTATIGYTNTEGRYETVKLPVLLNALMEYTVPQEEVELFENKERTNAHMNDYYNVIDKKLYSFAQESDSICFSVEFPNFQSLDTIRLEYNNPVDDSDVLQIRDITVYEDVPYGDPNYGNRYDAYKNVSDAAIDQQITGKKMLYYSDPADHPGEYDLSYDQYTSRYDYNFVANRAGAYVPETNPTTTNKNQKDYSGTFLVTLYTADVKSADTTEDVSVIFDYITTTGKTASTPEYNLREVVMDYYGYTPGYDTIAKEVVDSSYAYGLSRGNSIKFFITAPDLGRITDVRFKMKGGSDEWQVEGIQVQTVTDIGKRILVPVSGIYDGIMVNRTYVRNVPGETIVNARNVNILIDNNDTKNYNVDEAKNTGDPTTRDFSDYYYVMDYDMATSDLHFDEAAKNYEVRVTVAGNETAGTAEDGCGSNNLFYFQLVFKNGVSGYVLANQQLESDGFRASRTETFTISTNEDFGELIAVNIVPDDITEDSSKLDKLCIDKIEVIKHNISSVDKCYVCSNVGWVNMEYRDKGGTAEAAGRSLNDIVTTASVTGSSYLINVEISIAYGDSHVYNETYIDDVGLTQTKTVTSKPFVGDMLADIEYTNSAGETVMIQNVQLVQKLYEYQRRTAQTSDYGYRSDPEWMFRANSIDRFSFSLNDAVGIKRITLKGRPEDNCYLNITQIAINLVTPGGQLYINRDDEYQKAYEQEPKLLTDRVSRSLPYAFYFGAGQYKSYPFTFETNKIEGTLTEESGFENIISRVPQSANDTMNVFLYMDDTYGEFPSKSGYVPTAEIYYSSSSKNSTFMTKITNWEERTEKETKADGTAVEHKILYRTGVSASNMTQLSNIGITADPNPANSGSVFDHAVIQQVRNGVVINTYNVTFSTQNAAARTGISAKKTKTSEELGETQFVTMRLGEDTRSSSLRAETYDVAVALMYTSTLTDPSVIFTSPYVYLTDSSIYSTRSGDMVNFTFSQSNVREIKGLRVVAMNGLNVTMDGAVVETYRTNEDGIYESSGYYNIDSKTVMKTTPQDIKTTSQGMDKPSSLKRADFTFVTMEGSKIIDSNGSVPIRMTLHYTDVNNNARTYYVEDIRKIAAEGSSFAAGGSATVSFFLEGAKDVTYVELEPYDKDMNTIASWNLQEFAYSVMGTSAESARIVEVGKTLYETDGTDVEPPAFNLSTIVVRLTVWNGNVRDVVDNEDLAITAPSGSVIRIQPTISGLIKGLRYYYTVEEGVAGGGTSIVTPQTEMTDKEFSYTVPENETGSVIQYTINVAAAESPEVKASVTISVPVRSTTTGGSGQEPVNGGSGQEPTSGGSDQEPVNGGSGQEPGTGGSGQE